MEIDLLSSSLNNIFSEIVYPGYCYQRNSLIYTTIIYEPNVNRYVLTEIKVIDTNDKIYKFLEKNGVDKSIIE